MSCPRNSSSVTSSTNSTSTGYVGSNSNASNNMTMTDSDRSQYNNNLTQTNPNYSQSKCRKISNQYPRFTPVIFSLSIDDSVKGAYSVVIINGLNFLPTSIGTTYVNFGSFRRLPIIYFNSNTLSFTIPLNAQAGNYSVVVVNVYNGNFSPQANTSYPGNLNVSNAKIYTIT